MTDWESAWRNGQTPWDMGQVSPPLVALAHELPRARHVLVPGCGRGLELDWLAARGYHAVGVDLAPTAIEAVRQRWNGDSLGGARVLQLDFFDRTAAWPRPTFDWMFDQTFFCALEPSMRSSYARRAAELIEPGGELWAISFRTPNHTEPPYDSPPDLVAELLGSAGFDWIETRPLDAHSHPARRGREALVRMQREEV